MNKIPWYYRAPPDGFSRYFIIKEIIKKLFTKQVIKILDVGGKGTYLWDMFKDEKLPYKLSVIDILPKDNTVLGYTYIKGDATKMDFEDNSFDVVVSTDVLEHIPQAKKNSFINESIRCAKELVIIAAPFFSKETDKAEHIANDFYKEITGSDHIWLKEHFEEKKPKKELIEKILLDKKLKYFYFESNNLDNWVLTLLFLGFGIINVDRQKLENISNFYNNNLLTIGDFKPPGYRQFYIIYKNKKLFKPFNYFFDVHYDCSKKSKLIKMIYTLIGKEINSDKDTIFQKSLEAENYKKELEKSKNEINNLVNTLNMIKSAKFFKLWQFYCKIRDKIFLNKRK